MKVDRERLLHNHIEAMKYVIEENERLKKENKQLKNERLKERQNMTKMHFEGRQ